MNAVGFHIPNAFDKVLAIEKCWLQDDISNRIRNAVRDYAYEHNYPFINLRTHEGMLRNMIVRTSTTGELMVILICKIEKDEEMALFKQLLQYVADTFPEITSLLYIINNKCNDTITDLDVHTFKGKDHIFEEKWKGCACNGWVPSRSTRPTPSRHTLCTKWPATSQGSPATSWFTTFIPAREPSPTSCPDKRVRSSASNMCPKPSRTQGQLGNQRHQEHAVFAGDMKDMLTQDFINEYGRPDVIITDPLVRVCTRMWWMLSCLQSRNALCT